MCGGNGCKRHLGGGANSAAGDCNCKDEENTFLVIRGLKEIAIFFPKVNVLRASVVTIHSELRCVGVSRTCSCGAVHAKRC